MTVDCISLNSFFISSILFLSTFFPQDESQLLTLKLSCLKNLTSDSTFSIAYISITGDNPRMLI